MNTETIDTFLSQVDALERRTSNNSRSAIFTKRAREMVVSAYAKVDGIWRPRTGANTAKADALMALGFEEAIYGRGRNLLTR